MPSSLLFIPKAVLAALARKVRNDPSALRNVTFGYNTLFKSNIVTTRDLRITVHKSSKHAGMATGIIRARREAENTHVRAFIARRTGFHRGTSQVIAKIPFYLGEDFNADALANAIENKDTRCRVAASGPADKAAEGTATPGKPGKNPLGWTWMAGANGQGHYYRRKMDGTGWEAWVAPRVVYEWTWCHEIRDCYVCRANGEYDFGRQVRFGESK